MGNEIKVFENEEFGAVRTIVVNDEPMFCLGDLCKSLDLTAKEVNRRLTDEVVSKHPIKDSLGRNQNMLFVNEDGLYDVILESRKSNARKFRKWVTSNVLPTIRKTGGYISNAEMMVNTYFGNLPIEQQTLIKGLFDNITAQQTKINNLTTTNEVLTTDILTWADRPLVNALVRRYAGYACDGNFATAWTEFKKELLYKYSININSRITAYLNKTGKKTKPKTLEMITDDEVLLALKTIVSLCESNKIDISDLLNKHKESV